MHTHLLGEPAYIDDLAAGVDKVNGQLKAVARWWTADQKQTAAVKVE